MSEFAAAWQAPWTFHPLALLDLPFFQLTKFEKMKESKEDGPGTCREISSWPTMDMNAGFASIMKRDLTPHDVPCPDGKEDEWVFNHLPLQEDQKENFLQAMIEEHLKTLDDDKDEEEIAELKADLAKLRKQALTRERKDRIEKKIKNRHLSKTQAKKKGHGHTRKGARNLSVPGTKGGFRSRFKSVKDRDHKTRV